MPPRVRRRDQPPLLGERIRVTRKAPAEAELLACGDPRTFDEREILFTACGTRVCDQHPTFVHTCRIPKHGRPGHEHQRDDRPGRL